MDHRLTPEEKDIFIEDALKTIPLAPMPRSITVNVMARIQKDIRPKLITWNDFVLSLVITLCIGALFITMQSLPRFWWRSFAFKAFFCIRIFWLISAGWCLLCYLVFPRFSLC
ncbi:MAG: hypothetical protein IPN96_15145 [Anaerolineales bacterium]|nr:hypothetical protein [Anaerolineales bacterium]